MKTVLSALALATIATVAFAFSSASSSFQNVDASEASAVTGGACFKVIAFGCAKVIGLNADGGVILGTQEGCGNLRGTRAIAEKGNNKLNGAAKWCSSSQSWSCGAAITRRARCALPIG